MAITRAGHSKRKHGLGPGYERRGRARGIGGLLLGGPAGVARQGGDHIPVRHLLLFVEFLWHAKGPHSSGSPIAFAACQGRDHILKGRLRLIWWTYYRYSSGSGIAQSLAVESALAVHSTRVWCFCRISDLPDNSASRGFRRRALLRLLTTLRHHVPDLFDLLRSQAWWRHLSQHVPNLL